MAGGSAVDAMIAAQAVLCVVSPDACGLGGDMFCLIHARGEAPLAVNGAGAAPMMMTRVSADGACAEGEGLLGTELMINLAAAQRRGGPRAYLHTAGVAVSDADGMTVSSLVSVFDDFGSCVFVPECGITLNNRAGGFTDGANAAGPGRIPVHTLAPAMVLTDRGTLALATPGADGQVQTLLQVMTGIFRDGLDLAEAVRKPRWRSEGGDVLIERSHPAQTDLARLGHRLRILDDGDVRFGAIVCAGDIDDAPIALSDWRRHTWSGVA